MFTLLDDTSPMCRPCIPSGFCVERAQEEVCCLYVVPANITQPIFNNTATISADPIDELVCVSSLILVIAMILYTVALTSIITSIIAWLERRKRKISMFTWETIGSTDSINTEAIRSLNRHHMLQEERHLFGFSRAITDFDDDVPATSREVIEKASEEEQATEEGETIEEVTVSKTEEEARKLGKPTDEGEKIEKEAEKDVTTPALLQSLNGSSNESEKFFDF